MHFVIFEGSGWESLAPLSLSRPTFTLVCGIGTLLEKQVRNLRPTRLTLWVRPQLADYCRRHVVPSIAAQSLASVVRINEPLDSDPAMLVDGSALFLGSQPTADINAASPCVALHEGTSRICHARVVAPGLSVNDALELSQRWTALLDLQRCAPLGKPVSHIWDLLGYHEAGLLADAAAWGRKPHTFSDGPWHLVNKDDVRIGDGARLGAGCEIDASNGPVVLASGSIIGANVVVQGPCFIGSQAEIMPVSLIRPGVSIGPGCKVGGEVSRTIVIGYSNKAHEGYLGDSYVGEWVNLGAGTTTSNLKTTYGSIGKYLGGKEMDTGRKFLVSLIGDHTKTAICTRFMSGSYVGYCAMIATSAHAPRFTPSFSFSTDKGSQLYRIEKAFEVAKAMFARRNRSWTGEDEAVMRYAGDAARKVEQKRPGPSGPG